MIASEAQQAAGRLAPADGLMLQAVWFDAGEEDTGRLLLTIHHLAVDGVSWRILLPDLKAAWAAIAHGETPALPARGTSFRRWAHALQANAQTPERVAELPLWREMWDAPALSLFDGALDPARDLTGTAQELTLTLPAEVTAALLTRVPAAFHAGINDVLLTGLALAVAEWCRRQGRAAAAASTPCCWMSRGMAVRIWPRGDGREEIAQGSTCRARWAGSPACSRCGSIRARSMPGRSISMTRWRAGWRPAERSRPSRSSCARCPTMGWATGCCAISTRRPPRELAQLAVPQIGFNYLGRFAAPDGTADFASAPEAVALGGGDPALALGACRRGQCAHPRWGWRP